MKIVECRTETGLAGLRCQWNALRANSASNTIFLTWEWATAWWNAYGTPGELQILLAFDEQNSLRGIAPLRRTTIRRFGRSYPALAFVGDGSADSDYLDFIISAGSEEEVLAAFSEHWKSELQNGTLLVLSTIPESSPNLPFLRALGTGNGMIWSESDEPCGVVALPAEWGAYLKQLSPRFRTKIRAVLRSFENRPEAKFRFCEQAGELDRLLPALFDLHQRRWARVAKPGVFRGDRKRVFYRNLSQLLLEQGWLCFSWLEWRGQIIACQYGFRFLDRYLQLQEGYDPVCEHLNPGIALRAWSIQEFLKQGIREYDFLAGMGRHKTDWGALPKFSKSVVLARARTANVLFCRGPAWTAGARQGVKRLVPEALLAARDAREQDRREAAFQKAENGSPAQGALSGWLRNALAVCYYRSPVPTLAKPIRERFQLRAGKRGAIGIEGRREPTVRILYFHRVNNEADPFFPALPTALFEKQMRFVARHYKVVSLSDAVLRLSEGGPSEPVLAITFDDGYQDNYAGALPILRRYGLPATIFLTTGSLDSREPLWFEKLALAFKKTALEFIDLEIDIPRRFSMRNEAERLRSNGELYEVLRGLPDEQRRRWLDEILSRLGSGNDRERDDKMLTWDQVRAMRKYGIEFGGHTVTHPFVSRLRPEQGCWEVTECKRRIEAELQEPVKHFAYPSGREQDVADWNKKMVQQAGYEAAVSTKWGVNGPYTDRMEMRRGGPWEQNPALFAAKLDWYEWAGA